MATKRRLRRERDALLWEIQIALARLGDLGLLGEIEAMPVSRKIASLKTVISKTALESARA